MENIKKWRYTSPVMRKRACGRGLSVFLAVLMLAAVFPASAFADEEINDPDCKVTEPIPTEETEADPPAELTENDSTEMTPEPVSSPDPSPETETAREPETDPDLEDPEPEPQENDTEEELPDDETGSDSGDYAEEENEPEECQDVIEEDDEYWEEDEFREDDPIEDVHLYERYIISKYTLDSSGPLNMDDGTFFSDFAGIAEAEADESGRDLRSHLGIPDDREIPKIAYQVAPFNEKYLTWYSDNLQGDTDCGFILWCADRMGYVSHGFFPKTDSRQELFETLAVHGNRVFGLNSQKLSPKANDLVFVPGRDSDSFDHAGVVLWADENEVTYVFCNRGGYPERRIVPLPDCPEGTEFIRITEIRSPELVQAADYLEKKLGISSAAAAGILGNIGYESDYYPRAVGDDDSSYGLCQWHKDRWDDLIVFCEARGLNFRTSLGQFRFLVYELLHTKNQMPTLELLRSYGDSAECAYLSAYFFCTEFEQPEHAEINGEIRGRYAFRTVYPSLFSDEMQEGILKDVDALNDILAEAEIEEDVPEEADETEILEDESLPKDEDSSETEVSDSEAAAEEAEAEPSAEEAEAEPSAEEAAQTEPEENPPENS